MWFFDHRMIRKFCPRRFGNFSYVPSNGASGVSSLCGTLLFLMEFSRNHIPLAWLLILLLFITLRAEL